MTNISPLSPYITPPPCFSRLCPETVHTVIPEVVYRVHRVSAQSKYSFGKGFRAKNHSTIINCTSELSRFGLAHLNGQTNIASPFISVYDNRIHAERVAKHFSKEYVEDTWVVTVITQYLAPGPVFRATDLLKDGGKKQGEEQMWLHWGEYLVMYKIPMRAVRNETPITKGVGQEWRAVGLGPAR